MEQYRAAFFDAATQSDRMKAIEAVQTRYFEVAPYVSTGIFLRQVA